MKNAIGMAFFIAAATGMTTMTLAQGGGGGPVAQQCASDIKKFCADKQHDGAVRACLEQKKDQVSAKCKAALDTTGGGQGRKNP
jgi:hypothetical protein